MTLILVMKPVKAGGPRMVAKSKLGPYGVGPCGPPWALMGCALTGVPLALVGWALMAPPGLLWAGRCGPGIYGPLGLLAPPGPLWGG